MIPQIEPWIDESEVNAVSEVIRSTWVTEHKKTEEFENRIKEITKANHAIAFFNGSTALYASLNILGIGKGDEVIVPNLTFIASPNSVKLANAEPILADIDKKTFNIDPKQIEDKITDKTKAIMPVHLYGQSADMDAIMKIAEKNNLFVIEDAAQAIGSKFNGIHAGTFGETGVLSFYGNKTITTGEGGILLCKDKTLAEKGYALKNHGRKEKGIFIHDTIGYNFSFTEMQAALGLAQLNKLNEIISRKQQNRLKYQELLADVPEIKFTQTDSRCHQVHWFTNVLVEEPEKLSEYLNSFEIGTRRFFYPINKQPCYNIKGDFPNSEYAFEHGLSLPSSANLKEDEIVLISKKIKDFFK